jgi:SAM-dependent methyltransferase
MNDKLIDPSATPDSPRVILYSQYVSSGAAGSDDGSIRPYFQKMIRNHLPSDRDARIFDFGCGGGELLRCCGEAGYRTLRGVDLSAQQVARAHAKGLTDIVTHGDALAFLTDAPANSYDVVLAFDILEHLNKPEVLQFFAQVQRILSPRGRLVLHVPNGDSPFFGSIRYGDFTHELTFTASALQQIASSTGFTSVRCYEDKPIVHGFKSLIRFLLWPLCRGLLVLMTAVETGSLDRRAVFSRNLLAIVEP